MTTKLEFGQLTDTQIEDIKELKEQTMFAPIQRQIDDSAILQHVERMYKPIIDAQKKQSDVLFDMINTVKSMTVTRQTVNQLLENYKRLLESTELNDDEKADIEATVKQKIEAAPDISRQKKNKLIDRLAKTKDASILNSLLSKPKEEDKQGTSSSLEDKQSPSTQKDSTIPLKLRLKIAQAMENQRLGRSKYVITCYTSKQINDIVNGDFDGSRGENAYYLMNTIPTDAIRRVADKMGLDTENQKKRDLIKTIIKQRDLPGFKPIIDEPSTQTEGKGVKRTSGGKMNFSLKTLDEVDKLKRAQLFALANKLGYDGTYSNSKINDLKAFIEKHKQKIIQYFEMSNGNVFDFKRTRSKTIYAKNSNEYIKKQAQQLMNVIRTVSDPPNSVINRLRYAFNELVDRHYITQDDVRKKLKELGLKAI